ncbi:hypothetical protein H4R22_000219 [Coemansia sp. RSA 1290]|nr:hypothetical protein H4R22_000219 [Coemansia sp. RSA 1290]
MAPTSVMQQTFWGRIPNATSKIALQGRREQSEHRPSYTEPGSSPSPARISKRKQSHPTRSPLASAAHSKRSHEDMECGLGLHTKSRRLSLDRHIPTPRSLWTDVPARAFRLSFSDEYLRDPHQYVQALISYDTQMNAPTHKSQSAGGSRSRRATPNSSSKPKPNSSTRRSRAVRMHNLQFEQPLSGDSENEDNNSVTTATSDINDLADIDTRASTKALSQDAAFANMDSQPSTAGPDISESQSLSMQTSMSKLHAAAGQGAAKPDPELTGSIDGRSNGSSSTPDSPDVPLAAGSPGLEPATAPAESDNIPSFQRAAPPAGEYLQSSAGPSTFNSQDGGQRISRYETSLSLRYDVEAALAYVLGVFSGAVLLVVEKKNDYVRFHAWQSSLLSAAVFFALVVTALISNFLYWMVLLGTIGLSGYMARRAYLDGAVFERFMLPYVGLLAAQFVDEE